MDNLRGSTFGNTVSKKWIEWFKCDPSPYCCYFRVGLDNIAYNDDENFHTYSFEFKSALDLKLKFSIDKRYSDFLDFVSELKKKCRARPPALPPKIIKKDQEKLEIRARMLMDWLIHVCNTKMFFGETLFRFIGLPKDSYNDYFSANPLRFLSTNVEVKVAIERFETVKSKSGKDTFDLFEIYVTIICKRTQENQSAYSVNRRFNEFHRLHSDLKSIFKKYSKPLPELPRKFKFGKNQMLKRQYRLENYLRLLLDYPDIFEVMAFRMFLRIEPAKFNEFNIRGERRFQTADTGAQLTLKM